MKRKRAFTLSEIMIAIAIIGITAAVVIPTFMNSTNGQAYRTKYKKAINTLTRAASANFGENSYDFRDVSGFYGENGTPIECYNKTTAATDGEFIGSDTLGYTDGNLRADLHNKSLSIYNIFHSFVNMTHSAMVQNYSVAPVPVDYNCAQNEPEGTSVTVRIDGGETITTNIINASNGRLLASSSGGFAPLCQGRALEQGGFNQGRMFMMDDGSVFTYDPSQTYCTATNPCYGYIDVNGSLPPNRVISCSRGHDSYILTYGKNADAGILGGTCEVKPQHITDIFPVLFYDQIVKPASWAAKSAFYEGTKNNQI